MFKKPIIVVCCFIMLTGLSLTSCAKKTVEVPRFVGKDIGQARIEAEERGLKLDIAGEVHSKFEENTVYSQDPFEGETVLKGTTVTIVISLGKEEREGVRRVETATIPQLIGLKIDEAREESKRYGYEVVIDAVDDLSEKVVAWQYPESGKEAQKGTKIFVVLGEEKFEPTGIAEEKESPASTTGSLKKVVCIDPGHQKKANLEKEPNAPGSDIMKEKCRAGGSGVVSGTPEYEINLEIALKLENYLIKNGYTVIMTRRTNDVDISNIERANIANESGASLFVRLHCDGSSNQSVQGVATLYPANDDGDSKSAAQYVQKTVVASTGQNDRGIVARSDITGFNWSKISSILVEMGFLSNPQEDTRLNEDGFQQQMAEAIGNGIEKYFNSLNL